jgi:tetratricopeptide (TPR) repeat protein
VAKNPKSPLLALAHYQAGDALMRGGDAAGAAKRLALFRDQPQLRNVPGVTERAMLRLGQAFAAMKQWDQSRQAFEQAASRLGDSPAGAEARYGMAWAFQQMKNYDNAARAYEQAVGNRTTESAARAQLQAGLCRLEQKRYPDAVNALLAVTTKFKYPELSAIALVEAARASAAQKQKDQAEKLLQQVIRDHPKSKWAEVAQAQVKLLGEGKPLQRPGALADSTMLAPEVKPAGLPPLGQAPRSDRASLDDPTAAASLAVVQTVISPQRSQPAPFLRLRVPDPYEFHYAIRMPSPRPENAMPAPENWPLGS